MNFIDYKKLGICAVPSKKGTKQPIAKWKKYQKELPTDEECKQWESKHGVDEVNIITGVISQNLFCIDIDSKFDLPNTSIVSTLGKALKDTDFISRMVICNTPSGGRHLIYRTPTAPEETCVKLTLRPRVDGDNHKAPSTCLVETRGEGGTIKYYGPSAKSPHQLDDIQTFSIDEHNTLMNVCKSLSTYVKEVKGPPREYSGKKFGNGISCFEEFNEHSNIEDMRGWLEEDGWSTVSRRDNGYAMCRPGKSNEVSATLGVCGDLFYNFSSNTMFDSPEHYNAAHLYCVMKHDGDWSECSRDLAGQGYGSSVTSYEDKQYLKEQLLEDDDVGLSTEEEDKLLSCVMSSADEVNEYLDYLAIAKDFALSDRLGALGGLMKDVQPGYYVAWAGSSGSGKTLSSRDVFNDYLLKVNQDGIYFTMELKSREFALRNANQMRDPDEGNYVDRSITNKLLMTDAKFRESVVNNWGNFFSVEKYYNIDLMFEVAKVFKAKRARQGRKLGVICIDFIQMADGGSEVSSQPDIARKLKEMAKVLDCIVVGILQLNSGIRINEEPSENDISGHKALYQTSDMCYLFWEDPDDDTIIYAKSNKARHTSKGKCMLKKNGMQITALPYERNIKKKKLSL